jgi:NADH-quinone oxidoreductase subunit N
MGYLLVALLAGGRQAAEAVTFYLGAYFAAILLALGVVALHTPEKPGRPGERKSPGLRESADVGDLRGLFWQRPGLASLLVTSLLSLAGLPVTGGFVAKIYVLSAGVGAALRVLSIVLIVTSVVGVFYYLRVVLAMAARTTTPPPTEARSRPVPRAGGALLLVLGILLVGLGAQPELLTRASRAAAMTRTMGSHLSFPGVHPQ